MLQELSRFLDLTGYIPHGYCLNWSMPLIVVNVGSDLLIALSYFSMPWALVYFARRRRDFPYQWLLWMFAAFILACGTTHFLGAVVLWLPVYGLDAGLKLVTAIISVTSAVMLWPMIPHALKLPSPGDLRRTNEDLRLEILKREGVEEALVLAKAAVEDSLSRERAQLAAIVENAEVAIFAETLEGIVTTWNRAAENTFGYTAARIIGRSGMVLVPEDSHQQERDCLASLASGGAGGHFECQRIREDGSRVEISVTISPIRDKEGQILGASIIARDISLIKAFQAELRRSEVKYRALFESSGDAVMLLTERGFSDCNQSALDLFGCASRDEFCSKHPGDLSPTLQPDGTESLALANKYIAAAINDGSVSFEWMHRRADDGRVFPADVLLTAMKLNEETIVQGVVRDITQRKNAEAQINDLAFYDPLTHLPNRRLLMDRLTQAIAASLRNQREGALLFVDLDHFKQVNDTHGHDQGDLLLQEVAERLSAGCRGADTVARIGGDEFVVLLTDLSGDPEGAAAQAEIVGQKILSILSEPYRIAGNLFRSTPSIGITLFGEHRSNLDELLKQADIAMYQAKAVGRNALRFYDPELQAAIKERAYLEADLHHGIQRGQILLHYQPQVNGEGRLIGAEALVRWHHPERGLVSPAEFIPLAEETGLILAIGDYVLETGYNQIVAWADRPETAHISLAVNVSARQFRQPDFVDQVLGVVTRTGADPKRLKLELTESMLVEDVPEIIAKMMALKARGIGFSLDDFGTGYSSLSYLKRLPLDQLKIDQSFVREVLTDANDAAIAKTVVSLAQSLGLDVIAEGVETAEQRDFLAYSGCHTYQGYFFSRPLALPAFEDFARRH